VTVFYITVQRMIQNSFVRLLFCQTTLSTNNSYQICYTYSSSLLQAFIKSVYSGLLYIFTDSDMMQK